MWPKINSHSRWACSLYNYLTVPPETHPAQNSACELRRLALGAPCSRVDASTRPGWASGGGALPFAMPALAADAQADRLDAANGSDDGGGSARGGGSTMRSGGERLRGDALSKSPVPPCTSCPCAGRAPLAPAAPAARARATCCSRWSTCCANMLPSQPASARGDAASSPGCCGGGGGGGCGCDSCAELRRAAPFLPPPPPPPPPWVRWASARDTERSRG